MKTWTIQITETYVSRVRVKAGTEEEALELAEELACERNTDDISCEREMFVQFQKDRETHDQVD